MKRIFSHPLVALTAGLCLRLFFVFKFPANSGDTVLYEEMAANWLKHHVYAMEVYGRITPVDLRMPGYPAFLAMVYAITGKTGADARIYAMIAQALVDLLSCAADCHAGGDSIAHGERTQFFGTRFHRGTLASGAVSIHSKLCGGAAHGSFCHLLYGSRHAAALFAGGAHEE